MRRLAICLLLTALPLAGCFNFDEPICAYACGPASTSTGTSSPRCPDDYECRPDGYCHKQGTTDVCGFTDASMVADLSVPDLTVTPDLTLPADMTNLDGAGTD